MPDDKELLALLRKSDEYAFKNVFELYVKRVYQFVYGYLKNKQDAEDVTQIVFQKFWEGRINLKEDSSVNGFLFKIAYNAAIDHMRRYAQEKRKLPIDQNPFALLTSGDPYTNGRKVQSLYEAAINLLPPKRRDVYLLSRHEGFTNRQIAERMGISVKTVENQMASALEALKSFFKGINE